MNENESGQQTPAPQNSASNKRDVSQLTPAAQRALEEAAARRKLIDEKQAAMQREIDGRSGLEPTRYDDWEVKGLTVDF